MGEREGRKKKRVWKEKDKVGVKEVCKGEGFRKRGSRMSMLEKEKIREGEGKRRRRLEKEKFRGEG